MASGKLPEKDAEKYVAVMLASSFLSVIIGAKLRAMARTGAGNDAGYWKLSPEDRANYNRGQQALPSQVWNMLVGKGLGGNSVSDAVARGQDLTASYSAAKRALFGLQGTAEMLRNSATGGGGMNFGDWLNSGLTPELRFIFGDNAASVAAGVGVGAQTAGS